MSLVDSNVVSRFLHRDAEKRYPKLSELVWELILVDGLAISFVTQFELRRGVEDLVRRGQGVGNSSNWRSSCCPSRCLGSMPARAGKAPFETSPVRISTNASCP
jgi:hypothetical protein